MCYPFPGLHCSAGRIPACCILLSPWLGRCFPRIPKRVTTTLGVRAKLPALVIPGLCSEPAVASRPEWDFHVFCPAFFCSPRPRVIYFYSVVACTKRAHLSLFVFTPSACLSTMETNSSGKVETSGLSRASGSREPQEAQWSLLHFR